MVVSFIHIPKNAGTLVRGICDSITLRYYGHDVNVFDSKIQNQMIIIRNPIDRFESAVRYALQRYSREKQIKYLIDRQIDTPQKWAEIWSNKADPEFDRLMEEMHNVDHRVAGEPTRYKWTYAPQSKYINSPKYVILYENLQEELPLLLEKIGIEVSGLPSVNSTAKLEGNGDASLSKQSIFFLSEVYKEDFEKYYLYKGMSAQERLGVPADHRIIKS